MALLGHAGSDTPLSAQDDDAPPPDAAPSTVQLVLTFMDSSFEPVPGVTIASLWGRDGYSGDRTDTDGRMVPLRDVHQPDDDGRFRLTLERREDAHVFIAMTGDQTRGALAVIETAFLDDAAEHSEMLWPTIRVSGRLVCPELGHAPEWANNYVYAVDADGQRLGRVCTGAMMEGGRFHFCLPPGEYEHTTFGKELTATARRLSLAVPDGESEGPVIHDLGDVRVPPSRQVTFYGKPAPEWTVTNHVGAESTPRVADYRGRHLFVIFWAYW